jgi:hypothetical protein
MITARIAKTLENLYPKRISCRAYAWLEHLNNTFSLSTHSPSCLMSMYQLYSSIERSLKVSDLGR